MNQSKVKIAIWKGVCNPGVSAIANLINVGESIIQQFPHKISMLFLLIMRKPIPDKFHHSPALCTIGRGYSKKCTDSGVRTKYIADVIMVAHFEHLEVAISI
jgi:hypothetical protein